jgi:hypothetical protein
MDQQIGRYRVCRAIHRHDHVKLRLLASQKYELTSQEALHIVHYYGKKYKYVDMVLVVDAYFHLYQYVHVNTPFSLFSLIEYAAAFDLRALFLKLLLRDKFCSNVIHSLITSLIRDDNEQYFGLIVPDYNSITTHMMDLIMRRNATRVFEYCLPIVLKHNYRSNILCNLMQTCLRDFEFEWFYKTLFIIKKNRIPIIYSNNYDFAMSHGWSEIAHDIVDVWVSTSEGRKSLRNHVMTLFIFTETRENIQYIYDKLIEQGEYNNLVKYWNSTAYAGYMNNLTITGSNFMFLHARLHGLPLWRKTVKWMNKVRPYAWTWLEFYHQQICQEGGSGRRADLESFVHDFVT